jgi:hypothetical protein
MHNEVLREKSANDQIIGDLVPIIEDMLEYNPQARPTAVKVRDRCQKALKRAVQLSKPDESVFPKALRILPDNIEPSRTPPDVPPRSHQHFNGLNLENVPFAESPQTPERPHGNNRDLYSLGSPAQSHRSVPTILFEHHAAARPGDTSASISDDHLLTSSPIQDTRSRPSSFWASQSRPSSGMYNGAPSTNAEWPVSGLQSLATADVTSVHRDGSRRPHRRSTHTKRSSLQKISRPFADINQVQSWIEKWKKDPTTAPPRPVSETDLETLRGRDQASTLLLMNGWSC